MKKIIFSIIYLILLIVGLELASYITLIYLNGTRDISYQPIRKNTISSEQKSIIRKILDGKKLYTTYDPILGWTHMPFGSDQLSQSNSFGIRSNREYDFNPPEGKMRISTFGDSFTHGDEVTNAETFQYFMESANPNIEVLNFGVGGYGMDQAYLRYINEGRQFKSNIVLIDFVPLDTFRSVNTFRPFYSKKTNLPLSKPRFSLENNQLTLLKNPIQNLERYEKLLSDDNEIFEEMGKNDFFYHTNNHEGPFDRINLIKLFKLAMHHFHRNVNLETLIHVDEFYNPQSEAFQVTAAIIHTFYREVINDGAIPIVVIFPSKYDLKHNLTNQDKQYHYFLEYFNEHQIKFLDLTDAFEQYGSTNPQQDYFLIDHYSPLANKIVAEYLLDIVGKKND